MAGSEQQSLPGCRWSWRLGLHADSAPCCRLLSALFLAPPPTPVGEEGGWALSRHRELKVNVCRHNEGLLPQHGGEARFNCPHGYRRAAAAMINILQRAVWWVQQRCDGRLAKSSSRLGFEVFSRLPPRIQPARKPSAACKYEPQTLTPAFGASCLRCFVCSTRSPPTLFVQRGRQHPRAVFRLRTGTSFSFLRTKSAQVCMMQPVWGSVMMVQFLTLFFF